MGKFGWRSPAHHYEVAAAWARRRSIMLGSEARRGYALFVEACGEGDPAGSTAKFVVEGRGPDAHKIRYCRPFYLGARSGSWERGTRSAAFGDALDFYKRMTSDGP